MSIHPSIAQLASQLAFVELSVILIPIYLWKKGTFCSGYFQVCPRPYCFVRKHQGGSFVCLVVLFLNFRVFDNS